MFSKNVKTVVKWEINNTIKSAGFIIFTLLIPIVMLIGGALPGLIGDGIMGEEKTVAVLDETQDCFFGTRLSQMESDNLSFELFSASREELRQKVASGDYDGGLVFNQEELAQGVIPFYLEDTSYNNPAYFRVDSFLQPLIFEEKMNQIGLSQEDKEILASPLHLQVLPPVQESSMNGGAGEDGLSEEERMQEGEFHFEVGAEEILPLVFGVLLFISVLVLGQILMYGVIKEKKNRIVEILLSSLSAVELLWGKLISFGILSMIQILIWVITGLFVVTYLVEIPFSLQVSAGTMVPLLLYFVLGYFLLSSLFAVLGSIMKDAESGSQVQGMIVLIPMLPMFIATPIMMFPDATWVKVLSFIPIFTPGMMLLRIGIADIPLWETVGTLLVLAVSLVVFIKISAKIFEGSILQYDRASTIKDMMNTLTKKSPAK
ncbi:ABC transporter permease [Candidatus Contubernalis alkaliaceticus]|uniref:ABC transporter permease n=1 Tax=Candidatus Contubernalis alkaliaceticus TaxID=338645 RepID=UPI001F4C3A36|nr:ABC transporter permease [Candidatus Contubernalis alkalaceticus]UNC91975.1 ABC transporter permease [Candidatus Contubernalis alkalaceticus]